MMKRTFFLICLVLLAAGMPLWSQTPAPEQYDDSISFIGMKVEDLFKHLGSPRNVYAMRGEETWQDDVVFAYNEGEFYVYRDRVWQVRLRAFHNMRVGDAKAVALLILGENSDDQGDSIFYTFSGTPWPLSLCVNISAGKISAIYLYRSDY